MCVCSCVTYTYNCWTLNHFETFGGYGYRPSMILCPQPWKEKNLSLVRTSYVHAMMNPFCRRHLYLRWRNVRTLSLLFTTAGFFCRILSNSCGDAVEPRTERSVHERSHDSATYAGSTTSVVAYVRQTLVNSHPDPHALRLEWAPGTVAEKRAPVTNWLRFLYFFKQKLGWY